MHMNLAWVIVINAVIGLVLYVPYMLILLLVLVMKYGVNTVAEVIDLITKLGNSVNPDQKIRRLMSALSFFILWEFEFLYCTHVIAELCKQFKRN